MASSSAACDYNGGSREGRVIGASRADGERARCNGGVSGHGLGLGEGAIVISHRGHRNCLEQTYVEEFHPEYHRFSKPLAAKAAPTKVDNVRKDFIMLNCYAGGRNL